MKRLMPIPKVEDRPRGLYQKRGVWWLSRQKEKKRVWVSLETRDYAEAVVKAAELENKPKLNQGGRMEAEIERYIASMESKGLSRRTVKCSEQMLGKLVEFFGNVTPESVTVSKAQSYYDWMKSRGMSETTAQTYIRRTRPFFQWLLDVESKLRENPFASVKMGKLSSAARKDFCRLSLRNQLIEKCTRPDLKFVLYCGFHAGLRRNEIVEARPCWFDLDNKLLTIRKIAPKEAARLGLDPFDLKDREERTIPLSKAFLEFLKQWQKGIKFEGRIEKLKMDQDYCIAPGTRRGRADYRYDFRRPFEEYMEEQKAEWVTPHTMRRTFASLHASAGTPLYHIAKWLGDDIGTTQKHYAHLAPDNGVFERGIG